MTSSPDQPQSAAINISLLRRLAIIVYDGLLLFGVLFFASIPVTIGLGITLESPWYPFYLAYLYIVAFLYYGWFWTHGGQTLAMKTWKARLQNHHQRPVSWRQAIMRFVVAIFSTLLLGAGFFWSLYRKDRATWHDLASHTMLIAEH
jgi:uncharacterized RDD family membrane protein YckC